MILALALLLAHTVALIIGVVFLSNLVKTSVNDDIWGKQKDSSIYVMVA